MQQIEVTNINDPRLVPYRDLTQPAMETGMEDIIIVESPKVILTALSCGLSPMSLLCEKKHITGDAAGIIEAHPEIPVYTGSREILASLTGYTLTRGVLCAMKCPRMPSASALLSDARRVGVIYDICDTTNIGAIFRSAAALGMDALLVSPGSCNPFNRRAIRVSMGAVFQIPWTFCPDIIEELKASGFETVSMALREDSIFLSDFRLRRESRYALLLGSEGYGLPQNIIDSCDYTVKIPMHNGVDSLNVAAAAAISFWVFKNL